MKKIMRICSVVMCLVFMLALVPSEGLRAEESQVGTPVISLKKLNNGSGVKIVIQKTDGADGYDIFITNRNNAYSKYLKNGGKYDFNTATVDRDGSRDRSYTVSGLPEGKYTFKVAAYKKDGEGNKDLSSYVYSEEKTVSISKYKTSKLSKSKAGDIVVFGSYEQDGNIVNGKEPIEWIVLSNADSKLFLLSKYALDCLPFNNEAGDVMWKDCSLRKWLNSMFYKAAFSKSEKKKITALEQNGISDKVILLSSESIIGAINGLQDDETAAADLRCAATPYAQFQGAWTLEREEEKNLKCNNWEDLTSVDGKATCWWWLMSPGVEAGHAASINALGSLNEIGDAVEDTYVGVRPVICISYK